MIKQDILIRLLNRDFEALLDFESLVNHDVDLAYQLTWKYLESAGGDGWHVPGGFCERILKAIIQSKGKKCVESELVSRWESFPPQAKENISYGVLGDATVLSNDLAMALFRSPSSDIMDKINILSSLIHSKEKRNINLNEIYSLFDELLASTDEHSKHRIERAIAKLKEQI